MKVGLVGCGLNSDYHLKFARSYGGAQVVGVVDTDIERARRAAAQHGIVGAYSDLETLVKEAEPEVVHILTPPKTHFELAKIAIQLGRHVLIEKPMTLNYSDANTLFELARRHQVKLCTMHNHFFDPCMLKARELIEGGRLGHIVNVESYYGLNTRIPAFRNYPAPNVLPWIYELPGGVYQDFLAHPLYVILEYTGKPRDVKVFAHAHGELPHGLPDEVRVVIDGEQALGMVTISFAARPHLHFLRVYGTRMMIEVDFSTMTTVTHPASALPKAAQKATYNFSTSYQLATTTFRNIWKFVRGKVKPYQGMEILIHRFYGAISTKTEPPVTERQALLVMETMDRIFKQLPLPSLNFQPIMPRNRTYAITRSAKVLVTGGTGLLGRSLVRRLIAEGYAVRVLARKLASVENLVSQGAEVFWGDVADTVSLEQAFDGVQIVVHAAAGTSGRKEDCETGTLNGTRNVLALCKRHSVVKLVYISSCSVYGVADYEDGQVVTEESPIERFPERRGEYSASKQQAEELVHTAMEEKKFPIVIMRPGTIFGEGGELFSPMIGFSLFGKAYVVIGNKKFILPFVYVENLVQAIVRSMESEKANGEIFTVVDDERIDKREYMDRVIKTVQPEARVIYIPYFLLDLLVRSQEVLFKILGRTPVLSRYRLISSQRPIIYDNSKLKKLGWVPAVQMGDALRRLIEFEKSRSYRSL
jgi:predicted dehydrogenase/nucleoside-diphosphate-sugar epimerase